MFGHTARSDKVKKNMGPRFRELAPVVIGSQDA